MYELYGVNHNIKNIYRLAAPFIKGATVTTIKDLKPAYISYLQSTSKRFPIQLRPELVVEDPMVIKSFAEAFAGSTLNDLNQEDMIGEPHKRLEFLTNVRLVKDSLKTLKAIHPGLYELFELAIHSIILLDSSRNSEGHKAHGGSTNECIGLIWLNIKPGLSQKNIVEMLIHEFTHTLIFLDELNFGHFNYSNLSLRPYWAISSILKRERPMDKVFHSILVSLELIETRRTVHKIDESDLIHPKTDSLINSTATSIKSVLAHSRLSEVCTPRAIEIMKKASHFINNIKGGENEAFIQ